MSHQIQNPATEDSQKSQISDLISKSALLRREKHHEEALACLEQASVIDPDYLPVLVRKGIILKSLSRFEESVACFDRILRCNPDLPEVKHLRISSLNASLLCHERKLALRKDDAEAFYSRGCVLMRLGNYKEALSSFDKSLEIEQNHLDALVCRGNALLELNRHEEALACYNRALELSPNRPTVLVNRGIVLQQLNRFDEALRSYSMAVDSKPEFTEAIMGQSHCRLAMGDYKLGWQLYEWRWKTEHLKRLALKTSAPLWPGRESISGKTILIWAEQGFGDTIQFVRYLPLVAKLPCRVILRVPDALKSLMETLTLDKSIELAVEQEPLPPHDYHCPLMSLPLAFGTTIETVPATVPYLCADPIKAALWRGRLEPCRKRKIGIAWAGRQYGTINHARDMRLEQLYPMFGLNADFVCLQKTIPEGDLKTLDSLSKIYRLGEELKDFSDTAALIENLDLVISVETSVAHLAGALGKPVWVMVKQAGEWRWPQNRADSPWYPNARIFRQKKPRLLV